jgi:hypothetical protein
MVWMWSVHYLLFSIRILSVSETQDDAGQNTSADDDYDKSIQHRPISKYVD